MRRGRAVLGRKRVDGVFLAALRGEQRETFRKWRARQYHLHFDWNCLKSSLKKRIPLVFSSMFFAQSPAVSFCLTFHQSSMFYPLQIRAILTTWWSNQRRLRGPWDLRGLDLLISRFRTRSTWRNTSCFDTQWARLRRLLRVRIRKLLTQLNRPEFWTFALWEDQVPGERCSLLINKAMR